MASLWGPKNTPKIYRFFHTSILEFLHWRVQWFLWCSNSCLLIFVGVSLVCCVRLYIKQCVVTCLEPCIFVTSDIRLHFLLWNFENHPRSYNSLEVRLVTCRHCRLDPLRFGHWKQPMPSHELRIPRQRCPHLPLQNDRWVSWTPGEGPPVKFDILWLVNPPLSYPPRKK